MDTTRGAGVTAAAATSLAHTLILRAIYTRQKTTVNCCHSDSPYHAFAHCRGFAPAASRRTRALVSVPFWGPPLPWPLRIIGLVGHYPTNNHNPPQSHPKANWLQFASLLGNQAFQHRFPIAGYPQFPEVVHVLRAD